MGDSADPIGALLDRLRSDRIVAVVRTETSSDALRAALAIIASGIRIVEITFTTPGAAAVIERLRQDHGPEIIIGAGTVTQAEQLGEARAAGADFAVSPGWSSKLVHTARDVGVPFVPGVLTPTEMQRAVMTSVRLVKLFPADLVAPNYLRAIATVFPALELMPTGGVDASNAAAWLSAGAIAVGVGGGLVAVGDGPEVIRGRAAALLTAVRSPEGRPA